jgi:YrbI family 3-deoxy-D-manno-octulosonate 8-phosphate phosphatase
MADMADMVDTSPPGSPLLSDIDLLVTDFDGVLTDNRVVVSDDGHESVVCNRADGLGCELLRAAGLPMLILSTEVNPVVAVRGAKLRIEVVQGCADKAEALRELARDRGVDLARVMYVGNDVNDLGALDAAGWPVVPADAHADVVGHARHVTSARGGGGVLRELATTLLGGAAAGAGGRAARAAGEG